MRHPARVSAAAVCALLLLPLAACSSGSKGLTSEHQATPPSAQAPGVPDMPEDRCDADAVQSLVGRNADAATVEQARSGAGADRARVLQPGQMVTMEYQAGRLNIDVDESGAITALRCG